MNQKQFNNLKVGSIVTMTQDKALLEKHGISIRHSGLAFTITKTDFGNNRVWTPDPHYGGDMYLLPDDIVDITGKVPKAPKFSRKDVEEFMVKGADSLLKSEMNNRIGAVRTAIQAAGSLKDHSANMKIVVEQLRQIKLIRAAIREKASN